MRFVTYSIDDQDILDFIKEREKLNTQLKLFKFKLDIIDQRFKRALVTKHGLPNFFVNPTNHTITSTEED